MNDRPDATLDFAVVHSVYWHDAFGMPKSHGCAHQARLDAVWLFKWTDPPSLGVGMQP